MGKGKYKVIVQSNFDDDMVTVAISGMIGSLEIKSSQGDKGDEGLRKGKAKEPRPNTPSRFHEYPNPIQEKENLLKAKI